MNKRLLKLAGVPLTEGHVIGKSDEFKVELDKDGQVHLIDGEGTILASLPKDAWKNLAERTYKSLGGVIKKVVTLFKV